MEKRVRIEVSGKVQGVFFRDYTVRKAQSLQLVGTVQNIDNGSVEIYVQGDVEGVELLEQWCWQGSPSSRVTDVIIEELPLDTSLHNFRTIYT